MKNSALATGGGSSGGASTSSSVDAIVSDHEPHHADEKELDFADAPFGISAIETAVPLAIDRLVPERTGPEQPVTEETATDTEADTSVLVAQKFAPAPNRSIAVLPFVNMSGDQENEYFADGLSEEILNFLAGVPDLQVTARTSSFQFKGKNMDVREVAEALNAAHVLEGSVRRSGDRARITAQLIRASDGYHLWSETYDRTLEDTFEVQTDIAESVTRALGVVMDASQRQQMLAAGVRDVEAFIAFQKGRTLFMDAHTNQLDMDMMAEAADWFGEAIRREPGFASAYFLRSDYFAHLTTSENITDAERQAIVRHACPGAGACGGSFWSPR